jgi:hypothetical protein
MTLADRSTACGGAQANNDAAASPSKLLAIEQCARKIRTPQTQCVRGSKHGAAGQDSTYLGSFY